jgi:hypothetical protein
MKWKNSFSRMGRQVVVDKLITRDGKARMRENFLGGVKAGSFVKSMSAMEDSIPHQMAECSIPDATNLAPSMVVHSSELSAGSVIRTHSQAAALAVFGIADLGKISTALQFLTAALVLFSKHGCARMLSWRRCALLRIGLRRKN